MIFKKSLEVYLRSFPKLYPTHASMNSKNKSLICLLKG